MISSMASISSSSSATVRVEKATSEFLIGPDWTMNIDICDTVNSNQMLAKDVVKALKKRLQHKNPKVQLLALTLLEMMVKNCGDYVHFQIVEKKILQEMVKIVKKKTDMQVRDKILTLIGSWHDAFGGSGGRYPQYIMAYEDLRRSGVEFPRRSPDAAPIITPPVTQPISRNYPQPGYGMPSSSSTRLDEAMAADQSLSLSSINSMRDVVDLLTDMLQAVDPRDPLGVKDEVIVDLVEQCRSNQKKLMQMLATTGDEELLGQGLETNDSLQSVLARHDAIASGSPLPQPQPVPPAVVTNSVPKSSPEKSESSPKSADVSVTSNDNPSSSTPVLPVQRGPIDEEEEEEDDFALLARRHSKSRNNNAGPSEAPSSPVMSNALVPINAPQQVRAKDQDIIDLLSITLSTATTTSTETPTSPMHSTPQPQANPRPTFTAQPYPMNHSSSFNNYVAPWAQPQPQPQHPTYPQHQHQPQQPPHQPQQYSYPPPPWAATPGYFTNQNPVSRPSYTYSTNNTRPTFSSSKPTPPAEAQVNNNNPSPVNANVQKPFIPSYRLFEDIDVFGNTTDGRFKATTNSVSGSNNQGMVAGRK